MKNLMILFLSFAAFATQAQVKYNVVISGDTVYNNGKAEFLCREMKKANTSVYTLRSLDASPLALINFSLKDTNIVCSARFPVQKLRYDVLYPIIDISVLMESYLRNKVIVDGSVDTVGLKAYCAERNIPLHAIEARKISRPVMSDSALAANAKADFERQVPFTIYNESKRPVSISIGSPSNNRVLFIPANGKKEERARPGEKVCLQFPDKTTKCTDVVKNLKEVHVSGSGAEIKSTYAD